MGNGDLWFYDVMEVSAKPTQFITALRAMEHRQYDLVYFNCKSFCTELWKSLTGLPDRSSVPKPVVPGTPLKDFFPRFKWRSEGSTPLLSGGLSDEDNTEHIHLSSDIVSGQVH